MSRRKGAGFRLHGKPFDFLERGPGPSMQKLTRVLEALRDGEVLDTGELAEKAGITRSSLFCYMAKPGLAEFRVEVNSRRVYWANRKTARLARKELKLHETN